MFSEFKGCSHFLPLISSRIIWVASFCFLAWNPTLCWSGLEWQGVPAGHSESITMCCFFSAVLLPPPPYSQLNNVSIFCHLCFLHITLLATVHCHIYHSWKCHQEEQVLSQQWQQPWCWLQLPWVTSTLLPVYLLFNITIVSKTTK